LRFVLVAVGPKLVLLGLEDFLGASDTASSPGSNQADLLAWRGMAADGGGVSNMLMVTTTMRMLDRIHANTLHPRPAVSLGLGSMVSAASLQNGLLNTTTTGDDANHGTGDGRNRFFLAGWHLDLSEVVGVANNGAELARSAGKRATVTGLLLDAANDGTLRHCADGEHVADRQSSLPSSVNKLASVHALSSDKEFLVLFIFVGIAEDNSGQGSTTARIMDNFTNNTANIASALGIVEGSQLCGAYSMGGVGPEHGALTFTLSANNTAHCDSRNGA